MVLALNPHLEVLPPAQRRLWDELRQVPSHFSLYDGTAIALRLGHRQSADFDFFGTRELDPATLPDSIAFLKQATIIRRERNTFSAIVERSGPVKVSFFGVPRMPRLEEPDRIASNDLHIASLLDLAGTKASVVQVRAETKDYLDIDALIDAGMALPRALAAAVALYGPTFNPQITLKALSYFDDGNLRQLTHDQKERLAAAARAVNLDQLPQILIGHTRLEP